MSNVQQDFPIPDCVGKFGTREEYDRCRRAYWVHFRDKAEQVLKGDYNDIMPLFVEFIPEYRCNFRCGHCPYKTAKKAMGTWRSEDGQKLNVISPQTTMSKPVMRELIDRLAEYNVGLLWTGGGEPTLNEWFIDGLQHSSKWHLDNAVYTNGSLLDERSLQTVFQAQPAWLRFSVNAGTPESHARFHGYDPADGHFQAMVRNLSAASRIRTDLPGCRTAVGASVIFDRRNVNELGDIAELVARIAESNNRGIDFALFRPVVNYDRFGNQIPDSVVGAGAEILRRGAPSRLRLEGAGIHVALGFDVHSLDRFGENHQFWDRECARCLASGWFGVVCPDGDMYLCTETTGKPQFKIGNPLQQSLLEIWRGKRRVDLINRINSDPAFRSEHCPPRCRPGRLNRVFSEIETCVRSGRGSVVEGWLAALRQVCYGPPTEPVYRVKRRGVLLPKYIRNFSPRKLSFSEACLVLFGVILLTYYGETFERPA